MNEIGDSVKTALDHWEKREWNSAVADACAAVDATAKERYPNLGVAKRFRKVVRSSLDIFGVMALPGIELQDVRFPVRVQSDLDDKRPDMADILYQVHRRSHGHDDEPQFNFVMAPVGKSSASAHFRVEPDRIQLPTSAVIGLLAIAVFAPESKGQKIPEGYRLSWGTHTFFVNIWWGWQDHFRDVMNADGTRRVTPDFSSRWADWTPVK